MTDLKKKMQGNVFSGYAVS